MTEHKRLEEALRQSQQDTEARARELEAIFEALTDGLLVYDAQGGILRCNTAARGIFGFEAHPEFASLPWQERASRYGSRDAEGQLVPSEDLVLSRLLRGEVFTSKEANDQRLQTPDGREVTVSITGRCLRHARGPISGAVAIVRDVTERRRLEQEVVERAAQLAAIFESVADGLVVTDAQGRMLQVNQALRTLLGIELDPTGRTRLQLEELAGYAAYTTEGQPLREGEDPISTALEGQVLTKEQSVDLLFRTRDGCEVWANGTSAPIRDQRGQIIGCVGVIRDVTAQRRQEQQTHETLTALLAMAEALVETPDQASDACLRLTPRADQVARRLAELTRSVLGCQYVSMAAVEPATQTLTPLTVVGLSPEEEQQWWASWRSPLHFGDGLPPGAVAALWRGEPILLDTPQALLPIWQRVRPEHKAVLVPMRAGETLVGMLRVDNRAQGEDYIGPNKRALIRAVTRLGALVLERERLLHERTEARANELALRETQAQMETFLGIAGHELKSPLTSIKLALQLMERRLHRLTQDEIAATHALAPSVEEVARARLQAARLERLVNELIDVSRVRAGKLELHQEPTDLAAIVREAVDEQRQANPARTFAFQLPSDRAVPVWGDADRLGQVVTNYLTNALKYSPANRPVAVGLDLDDRQARVWVRDQGPGLPPQEHERIWDRFHRVKGIQVQSGTGVGLGLGLHICRTIVEWHQGQVGVESMPGQGSTFWFTLPLGSQG
jgi:PAS domain S-box-containing protein